MFFLLCLIYELTLSNTISHVNYHMHIVLILKEASYYIFDVKFLNIKLSGSDGGAIYLDQFNNSATVSLNRTIFYECVASRGGAIYSTCSLLKMRACCFLNCNAVIGQDFILSQFEGKYQIGLVTCSDHGGSQDNQCSYLFSMTYLVGNTKNSNFSNFKSKNYGFMLIDNENNNFSFSTFSSLESNHQYSFFLINSGVEFSNMNFVDCNSAKENQFYLSISHVVFSQCIIHNCTKLTIGIPCIDCFFDVAEEPSGIYTNCSFLTRAPLINMSNLDCYSFDNNCSIFSYESINSTITQHGYSSCFFVDKCLFYGIHSNSNGGSMSLTSPFISLIVISSVFSNSSSHNNFDSVSGGGIYFVSMHGRFSMIRSCGFNCHSDSAHMACIILDDNSYIMFNISTITSCSPLNRNLIGSSMEISNSILSINSSNNFPNDYSSILSFSKLIIDFSLLLNNTASNGVLLYSINCDMSYSCMKGNICKLNLLRSQNIVINSCTFNKNLAYIDINAFSGYVINCISDHILQISGVQVNNISIIEHDTSYSMFIDYDVVNCFITPLFTKTPSHFDFTFLLIFSLILGFTFSAAMTIHYWKKNRVLEATSIVQQSVLFDFG